jgi:DNA invertase Pin-like site-specific DNA recombinase
VYVDKLSGARDSRPALNDLMFAARQHCFNAVIVWKLDRLGRSLQHLMQIIQEFKSNKIDFICTSQPIDTTTSSGELVFHIFGAIAQFERELIVERINLGLGRARRQGKQLGLPAGSCDKKRRCRSGYYQRWIREKGKQSSHHISTGDGKENK